MGAAAAEEGGLPAAALGLSLPGPGDQPTYPGRGRARGAKGHAWDALGEASEVFRIKSTDGYSCRAVLL